MRDSLLASGYREPPGGVQFKHPNENAISLSRPYSLNALAGWVSWLMSKSSGIYLFEFVFPQKVVAGRSGT